MNSKWSKKFDRCQQCGTHRFKHAAKGLCTRCYRLVKELEKVDRWKPFDLQALAGYPFDDSEEFNVIKSGYIKQIEDRLRYLKNREQLLGGPVEGLVIEFQLRRIAGRCGAKEHLFHQVSMILDEYFSKKQRIILYELLNRIEEHIRWEGLNLIRAARPDL